jgi:HK97 family phage major capsid protein
MEAKELETLINDIKAGFDTSKAKYGDIDAKVGKVEAYIKELDGKIKASEDELKAIAIRLQAPPQAGEMNESKRLRTKMFDWVRYGVKDPEVIEKLSPDPTFMKNLPAHVKALGVGNDTTGGVLTEPEYEKEILKTVTEYSPIMEIGRASGRQMSDQTGSSKPHPVEALWPHEA